MKLTFHVQGCCCMFCSVQNRPVGRSPDRAFYAPIQQNSVWCKNNRGDGDDDGWIAKFLR